MLETSCQLCDQQIHMHEIRNKETEKYGDGLAHKACISMQTTHLYDEVDKSEVVTKNEQLVV